MTVFALDAVPRTLSRSQACDVLSSQANVVGYRAVRAHTPHDSVMRKEIHSPTTVVLTLSQLPFSFAARRSSRRHTHSGGCSRRR